MGVSKPIDDKSVLMQKAVTINGTSDEVCVTCPGTHTYIVDISTGTASVQLFFKPYGFANYRPLGATITAVAQTVIVYECPYGASYQDTVTNIGGGAVVTSSIAYAGGK